MIRLSSVKRMFLVATLCCLGLSFAPGVLAVAVLDDYSGPRFNVELDNDIITAYQGEDPGQVLVMAGGVMTVNRSPTTLGYYWQFQPYDYIGANGHASGWIESGTWNADFNRLRFRFRCDGNVSKSASGYGNIQFGTYVKPQSDGTTWQGAHYYHHLDPNVYAGRWVYVELNRTPQHQVGGDPHFNWPEDPEMPATHYFDGLTRFYFDTQDDFPPQCEFEPITFSAVPDQPDQFVSSLTYQYTGTRYEATWSGPKNSALAFAVRYSAGESMLVGGFASGTNGGTVDSTGNDYTNVIWASPALAESPTGMYIAIQPDNGSAFTEVYVPYSSSAPDATPPAGPTGLAVQ